VVDIALAKSEDEVVLVTDRGQMIRTRVDEIRETGPDRAGVKVMAVDDEERVVAIRDGARERCLGERGTAWTPTPGPWSRTGGGDDGSTPAGTAGRAVPAATEPAEPATGAARGDDGASAAVADDASGGTDEDPDA